MFPGLGFGISLCRRIVTPFSPRCCAQARTLRSPAEGGRSPLGGRCTCAMRRFTAGVSALGLKAGWGTTREAPATIELEKCEEGDLNPHGFYPTSPSN